LRHINYIIAVGWLRRWLIIQHNKPVAQSRA